MTRVYLLSAILAFWVLWHITGCVAEQPAPCVNPVVKGYGWAIPVYDDVDMEMRNMLCKKRAVFAKEKHESNCKKNCTIEKTHNVLHADEMYWDFAVSKILSRPYVVETEDICLEKGIVVPCVLKERLK